MRTLQQIFGWIISFALFLSVLSLQVLAEENPRKDCALTELAIGEKDDTPVAAFVYPSSEGLQPVSGTAFKKHDFIIFLLSKNTECYLQLRKQKKEFLFAKSIFAVFLKARFFSSEESEEAFPIA